MRILLMTLMLWLVVGAGLLPAAAFADESLQTALALDVDQARQVGEMQARHRKQFAAGRQAYNAESRALRRARLANDAAEIARLESLTESMRADLTAMRAGHDAEIRRVLRPDQSGLFDAHIVKRQQMRGSSRDEWIF